MINKVEQILNLKLVEYFLLAAILVAGFAVRLYKIDNPVADWHSWRQADTASVSRTYLEQGINLLYPRYHDISSIQTGKQNPEGFRMVEFPIYNAINAVLALNLPKFSLEVWARLITIFCALTSAFFLYLIARRLMGAFGGLLTAFFYLFIPYNIYFTRVILPDPMGVTFGIISIWAFLKYFDNDRFFYFYLSAIFFSLMMLIKPYLGFYGFPIAYLAVKKFGFKNIYREKGIRAKALIFAAIAFIPFLLWRAWEARFPEGIPFYSWAFNGNHIRFKPSFWYWIFGERLGHLILGSLGLIPFIFGVFNTKVKNLFIQWFLAGALFYVCVVASANVMHDYYQILIIPAVALALASGIMYLLKSSVFNKWLTTIALVIAVGVMLITGWNQIVGDYQINHPEILIAGAEINRITPKNALVVAPYDGDTAFLYATHRRGWPAVDDSIDNIIKRGASYYVSVDLSSPDTKMFEARFKTVEKTDKYIILDLRQELPTYKPPKT